MCIFTIEEGTSEDDTFRAPCDVVVGVEWLRLLRNIDCYVPQRAEGLLTHSAFNTIAEAQEVVVIRAEELLGRSGSFRDADVLSKVTAGGYRSVHPKVACFVLHEVRMGRLSIPMEAVQVFHASIEQFGVPLALRCRTFSGSNEFGRFLDLNACHALSTKDNGSQGDGAFLFGCS